MQPLLIGKYSYHGFWQNEPNSTVLRRLAGSELASGYVEQGHSLTNGHR
jgi:hypothetical protein